VEKNDWVVGNLFDVVQAFLNSHMDPTNPVYIYLPPLWKEYCEYRGIEYDPTDLIELGKAQYGQVDAAKRWMDMFIKILTEAGGCELKQSKVDPCVLYKRNNDNELIVIVIVYVDDGWVCGKPAEVSKILAHLRSKVEILDVGRMDTHLRVNYKLKKDQIGWYYECEMKEYIDEIISDFEEYIETAVSSYKSPAVPGSTLLKLTESEQPIDTSAYQKFVGQLLYAVMKVLPDCANAVRDLTCHLSAPGEEHWAALERLIGYLKYNYRPLKLRSPRELQAVSAFDADWGTDRNDRKSISSLITTLGGTSLVNWQCKKQTSVALSSCEAETQASTPAGQDVVYINNLVTEIMGHIELPSHIYGDNVASLFLAQNNQLGQRTKHIDIRHRYIHDLTINGTVELRHVRSEENSSDINSKNVTVETHQRLADRLYEGLPLVYIEEGDPDKEDVAVEHKKVPGSAVDSAKEKEPLSQQMSQSIRRPLDVACNQSHN